MNRPYSESFVIFVSFVVKISYRLIVRVGAVAVRLRTIGMDQSRAEVSGRRG
jgi:hypothetical protein